jgi:hypothetical protein
MNSPDSLPTESRAFSFGDQLDFRATLQMALRALGRNKMRSALTMLGITIGIGAVICTVAIGEGGSSLVQAQLAVAIVAAAVLSIATGIFFGYYPARKAS